MMSHQEAAAVLSAYSEKNVPLPLQSRAEWYGTVDPGRWWRLVWAVSGWVNEGDKFAAVNDVVWWPGPLAQSVTRALWSELAELAEESDAWAAKQGRVYVSPVVDVAAFRARPGPIKRTGQLAEFLNAAWKALQAWRRDRRGGGPVPPQWPSGDGIGTLLVLGAAAYFYGKSKGKKR